MRRTTLTKLFLCTFVLLFAAISIGANKFSKVYENATQLMVDGDYAGAAELFDSIASYEDSSTLSMYCKANSLAQQGKYEEAISAFEFFGDYKDCKYLVVYYSACQIEDLASDDPLRYLDAAAKFKTISLFRDSAARVENCRQKLYDAAAGLLEQGDYETACDYFNALDGYSDSGMRVKECFYRQGLDYMKEQKFDWAAELFELAEDYEGAEEQLQLARKLSALKVGPEYMLIDGDYDIIYEYEDGVFYLGDVSELLFDYYSMRIQNQGKEKLKYRVTCEMDGESYSWKESELDAGKTTWYSFNGLKAPECFQEGVHTCVWYIDGVEVLNNTFTVKSGISEKREKASALAGSLEVETAVAQYAKETDELSGFVTEATISCAELQENKDYVLTVIVRNTTDSTISLAPVAVIDGKFIAWDSADIEPSRVMRFYSSEPLGKGSHKMQVLINGIEAGEWSFEIVDTLEKSPLLTEAMTPEIGQTVRFGKYEQDNDISNGSEDIEWTVLDVQNGKALLISKFALNCVPYNEETVDTTWESCSLRAWLNDDFLKEAFSDTERKKILLTEVDNSEDQGNPESEATGGADTNDHLFLLSWREASQYFTSGVSRICRATPYAAAQERCTLDDTGTCFWWLRSPGVLQDSASFIDSMGGFGPGGSVGYREHADRPAMWVEIPAHQDEAPARNAESDAAVASDDEPGEALRVEIGNMVTFGVYEQDNDLSNGPEDIEWLVLDAQDGKALLISKYALDSRPYHSELTTVTWEASTMRAWLNNEFLHAAFTDEQREKILLTSVNNSDNQDFNGIIFIEDENTAAASAEDTDVTEDYVFLLSFMEGHHYFASKEERSCQPTPFAIDQGAYEKDGYGRWWYRATANEAGCISCVTAQGSSYKKEITDPHSGVRPAIWVKYAK